ncbi:cytochrome c peroxidase [Pseudobacteriovorax antillogorgiicola]|uniref:Cytochrome c peroxidase n=1 Tax=Pseudobacteriovorax antillogorgiicola TaxID=1513793 RepID=A0A1Y6CQU2_9BACT|nr:cytochrome c peroxidase [Pseudobacteriovorax antillogorgiicola]TCS42860.1 cytochrome c peroxidase [Pseudobacteriovorax antillogorgiicola]SMF81991.1 cytochrome c peroxidase [Pseudobacteriovorax antillogorgiicola]
MKVTRSLLGGLGLLLIEGCSSENHQENLHEWDLPHYVEQTDVMSRVTDESIALGKALFFSSKLSLNGRLSCASCHDPKLAFTKNEPLHNGVSEEAGIRNAPSLANLAFAQFLTWSNLKLRSLQHQAMVPLFGDNPIEMGAYSNMEGIISDLANDDELGELYHAAYGIQAGWNWDNILDSLQAFQLTLVSLDSSYDRYLSGDMSALTDLEKQGWALFRSPRLACSQCHGGPLLSNNWLGGSEEPESIFFNNGLYGVPNQSMNYMDGGEAHYPAGHSGLGEFTLQSADDGKFRVPSLRNVAVTAPYMHDGSIGTLEDVISMYERGGRQLTNGHWQGDGRLNPNKDSAVKGFTLTQQEREALLAFLNAQTDEAFLEFQE